MFRLRNGRRIGFTILITVLITVAIVGVVLGIRRVYTVQTVYVEGNIHYTEEQIMKMVMDGPLGNNSLYLSLKYANKGMKDVPFVDQLDVKVLSPDTIKITVYEKALAGYVKYIDTFVYFDKDGYVVESSSLRTVGIPQVTGLSFDYVVLGQPLPVTEHEDVFKTILEITKLLNKYDLAADKIYFHSGSDITIYFGNVRVALGSEMDRLEDKIMLLPEFVSKLNNQSGTIQMETYDESGGKYTFKPD